MKFRLNVWSKEQDEVSKQVYMQRIIKIKNHGAKN